MKFGAVLLLIFLVAGAVFYLLNPSVVLETRSIQLPGATATGPVLGLTLLIAAGFMLLMLFTDAVVESLHARDRRRFEGRIVRRDQEIAHFKSGAYDEVSQKLETMGQDLSARIDNLARSVEERTRELAGTSAAEG